MGLTGEGYRTGGVATIKSCLIRLNSGLGAPSTDEIALEQVNIEMNGGKLPLFNVRYEKGGKRQPYLLLDMAAQFLAAVKLGHIVVRCKVEGEPDLVLERMEREENA